MIVLPAILAPSEQYYQNAITKIKNSTLIKDGWVQVDFIDNKFVQNETVPPEIVKKDPPQYKLEAQLLVIDPDEWVLRFSDLDVGRIVAPVELDEKILNRFIDLTKQKNYEVGLSINPNTPIEAVYPYEKQLDAIMIMGVYPGFQGQSLDSVVFNKIRSLRAKGWKKLIGVDGGVNETNIKDIEASGADYVAVGSGVFKYDNIDEGLKKIYSCL